MIKTLSASFLDRLRRAERAWPTLRVPFSASLPRTLAEGVAGWLLAGVLSALFDTGVLTAGERSVLHSITSIAGWLWILCWPAWRLQRTRAPLTAARLAKGALRLCALSALLLATIALLGAIDLPSLPHFGGLTTLRRVPAVFLPYALWLGSLRLALRAGFWLQRWTSRRLQRQLMISHLAAIMVIFVALTALGSIIAVAVVARLPPDASNEARATAAVLRPSPMVARLDRQQTQSLLDALMHGRIQPGEPFRSPLDRLLSWSDFVRRALVLDPKGSVLAVSIRPERKSCPTPPAGAWLPAATAQQLTARALSGQVTAVPVPVRLACGDPPTLQQFAAAPIYTASGAVAGIAVVQGFSPNITPATCVQCTVAVFSASTIVVLGVMVIPTLILSAIAAFIFARGPTRRLRRVSQAAQAMAAGDLSQRVPVDEPVAGRPPDDQHEIATLARDFNRMAASLETMMQEVRASRTTAEQALKARQELIAGVSHELRTPIAVVQAHLDAVAIAADGPEDAQLLQIPATTVHTLRVELDRLTSLVEDLFSLTRADNHALHLRCEPTDLAVLVREVAAALRPLAQRERGISLAIEAARDLPRGMVDADRLQQILANLVRNALRHTPEGGIVAIGASYAAPWLVVTVADTGEGIAPEHLPHIFEPFYRVERSRSRNLGGAGLGLAIVKEFVTLMGGRITVQSSLGEGTCFQVYLPSAAPVTSAMDQ